MTTVELEGWVSTIDRLGSIQRDAGKPGDRSEPKRIVSKRKRRP